MRIQFLVSYLCLGCGLWSALLFSPHAMGSTASKQGGQGSFKEVQNKIEMSYSRFVQTLKDIESRVKELEGLSKDRQDADYVLKINQVGASLRDAISALVGSEGDFRKAILIFQELYSKTFQKTPIPTSDKDDLKDLIPKFHDLLNAVEAALSFPPEIQNVGKNDSDLKRKKGIQELRDILNGLVAPKTEPKIEVSQTKEVSQAADPHETLFSSQFQKLLQGDLEKRIQKARKYLLNLLITELGSEKDNNLFTSYRQLFDNQSLKNDFNTAAIQKLKTNFEKYFQTFFPQDKVTFFPIKHPKDNNIRFVFVVHSFQQKTLLFYGIEISLLKEKFPGISDAKTSKVLYKDKEFNAAEIQMPEGYSWFIDFSWIDIYTYQKGFLTFNLLSGDDSNKKTVGIQSVKDYLKPPVQTSPVVNSSSNVQPLVGKTPSSSKPSNNSSNSPVIKKK